MNRHNFDDEFAPVDAYEVVEAHWPYDGPYSGEQTTAAALMVDRLVRYLNNAAGKPSALPYAATAGSVLASLYAAVHGLEHLMAQLADFAQDQADDPSLYDDRHDRPGSQTALELADELDSIGLAVTALAERLGRAAQVGSHLGSSA